MAITQVSSNDRITQQVQDTKAAVEKIIDNNKRMQEQRIADNVTISKQAQEAIDAAKANDVKYV